MAETLVLGTRCCEFNSHLEHHYISGFSSAGRAPFLQIGGFQWFDPTNPDQYTGVSQLVESSSDTRKVTRSNRVTSTIRVVSLARSRQQSVKLPRKHQRFKSSTTRHYICDDSSIGRMSVSKTEDMGSSPTVVPYAFVAQLVERRSEEPSVSGSIPLEGTIKWGISSIGRALALQA